MIEIINANALQIPLADQSVHMVVTSPPYWALRDYGVGGQLGLEATPELYVENMVRVFREVWRVLRDDGVLYLNIGDSYAANRGYQVPDNKWVDVGNSKGMKATDFGLKPKDLVGIPWRLAFALQADGWYLRSDIIWHKPNPMPESVTDRPTKSHEYIFLLSKSQRYFYDQEAVREVGVCDDPRDIQSGLERGRLFDYDTKEKILRPTRKNDGQSTGGNGSKIKDHSGNSLTRPDRTRNLRDVWTIATQPYPGSHFATFPEKLVEPCIKAGTSERGVCPHCGKQWERVVEKTGTWDERKRNGAGSGSKIVGHNTEHGFGVSHDLSISSTTLGFRPACDCPEHDPIPSTVFDPFAGSGTVGRVAARLGRSFVGVELSMEYIGLARQRMSEVQIVMAGM